MEPLNFVYWLQGFFELSNSNTLTPEQVKVVKEHINLVIQKVTPSPFDFVPSGSYQKLFTGHSGITAAGLC